MRVHRAHQAQAILGPSDLVMITERGDAVALLIGQMVKMGVPEVLDRHRPRHGTQRGLSGGWTAVLWLASIVTEGDHRPVSGATYLQGMPHTLSDLTAQGIAPLDVRDDRLSHRLQHLRKPASGHQSERDLNARSLEGHALPQDVSRCDATTVAGAHEVTAGGLVPCGHRQDEPTRPQSKVMMGAWDPVGLPLATDVLSGERADDGFYRPIIERMRRGLHKTGLLLGGAGQMRALETRASLARHQDWSLAPWPLTGATAEAMDAWITAGVTQGEAGEFARIGRTKARGHEVRAAEGYACARTCWAPVGARAWSERVVVVRSPTPATQQAAGLATRLRHAETPLAALTPPRGRGKRPITDEATLVEAMARVLTAQRVPGLLSVPGAKQVEQTTPYVGRGRGSVSREQRVIQPTRSHSIHIARQADTLAALRQRFGWKAFVTNAGQKRRSLPEAVWCYRPEDRVERLCNRLKSRVPIAPLFVKRNEHMEGLTYLLTRGGRVVTVTELVLRRSLEQEQGRLPG